MFSGFPTSKVVLHKQSGEIIQVAEALVQPNMIFIDDAQIPVEEDDVISRDLPNGLQERYVVLDRGYYEEGMGLDAHYQIKVRKESTIRSQAQPQVTYNLHGPNSRVNNQSLDLSTNTVSVGPENVFTELKRAIELHVPRESGQDVLLGKVEAMKEAQGTEGYLHRYQEFIKHAADHMTLVAPFIPALTHMLGISS